MHQASDSGDARRWKGRALALPKNGLRAGSSIALSLSQHVLRLGANAFGEPDPSVLSATSSCWPAAFRALQVARQLLPHTAKGCQALPGLFRRKSLKTRVRSAQRVSRIRRSNEDRCPACPDEGRERVGGQERADGSLLLAHLALAPFSNRQCCRIEIAVTHTKQRIGIHPNRQENRDSERHLL